MSVPKTIQIDGIDYVQKSSVAFAPTTKQIVILDRGWVVVGDVAKNGNELNITNCSVIRVWGTDKGLGQLALTGPTSKTILDPCGDFTVNELCVVGRMNVTHDKF